MVIYVIVLWYVRFKINVSIMFKHFKYRTYVKLKKYITPRDILFYFIEIDVIFVYFSIRLITSH